MPEIVFVVQNETHAANFVAFAELLDERGWPEERIAVLHLDNATGLDTGATSRWSYVLDLPAAQGGSFYRMGPIARARYLADAAPRLRRCVAGARALVVGNDGALQRVLAREVRRQGGRVYMVLDGLLEGTNESVSGRLRAFAKHATFRMAEALSLEPFAPSDVGFMKTDRSFAMSDHVAEVLRSRRRGQQVDAMALPRLVRQRQRVLALRRSHGSHAPRRFTYYTSAFLWHGDRARDELQWRDLTDVVGYAERHPDEAVAIRVHPREDPHRYSAAKWPVNVALTDHRTPLEEDIAASEFTATALSTVAFEAWQLGLPVLLYERNFGPAAVRSSWFAELTGVVRSTSLEWRDASITESRPLPTIDASDVVDLIEDAIGRGSE